MKFSKKNIVLIVASLLIGIGGLMALPDPAIGQVSDTGKPEEIRD